MRKRRRKRCRKNPEETCHLSSSKPSKLLIYIPKEVRLHTTAHLSQSAFAFLKHKFLRCITSLPWLHGKYYLKRNGGRSSPRPLQKPLKTDLDAQHPRSLVHSDPRYAPDVAPRRRIASRKVRSLDAGTEPRRIFFLHRSPSFSTDTCHEMHSHAFSKGSGPTEYTSELHCITHVIFHYRK